MKRGFSQKTRKNISAFSFFMCLIVVGGMAVYYQYMKKQQLQTAVQTPATETEKLIAKDLEMGYPETPTEVMKLWGRINQCMYNSNLKDEDFTALLKQLRLMYSSELLEQNKESAHSARLKEEIGEFRKDKGNIVSYSAETGTAVQYKTVDKKECAYIRISYFINRKNKYSKNFEDFVLVREDGKWKVQGFKDSGSAASSEKEAAADS